MSRFGVIAERGVETAGQRTSQGPAGSFVSSLNAGVAVRFDSDMQRHRVATHRAVLDVILLLAGRDVDRHDDFLAARFADVRRL